MAGVTWNNAKLSSLRITQYIISLEIAYAVHELVFGLLFLIIVAIPFRQRVRWAWWALFVEHRIQRSPLVTTAQRPWSTA